MRKFTSTWGYQKLSGLFLYLLIILFDSTQTCNSFEENTKEMRYCNAKLNVISDVLRDGVGGLSKTITNWQ